MKKPDTIYRLEEALNQADAEERESLRSIWDLSEKADETPNITNDQIEVMWQHVSSHATPQAASRLKQDRQPAPRKLRRLMPHYWRGIAIALFIAIIGAAFLLIPVVQTAPFGERLIAYLPDGSMVELNSGAKISHPRFFMGTRTVSLEGEAYFDVIEASTPFIVHTFNANVEVLGTTFNVKAWDSGWRPESRVTLTSGSVRLSIKGSPAQSVVMLPGQTVTLRHDDSSFINSASEDTETALAWRSGELVFKDEVVMNVLEEIERRFGTNVELRVNRLAQKQVTFAYRQVTNVENVLEDLCHALNLQYRPISDGYELFEE